MKKSKELERYFKGVANHRRIEILELVKKHNGITLHEIADILNCNIKTVSEHTRRLVAAGLIEKQYRGASVVHSLAPHGRKMVAYLETF